MYGIISSIGIVMMCGVGACSGSPRPMSRAVQQPQPSSVAAQVEIPADVYACDLRVDPVAAMPSADHRIAQAQGRGDTQAVARPMFDKARAAASGGNYALAIKIAEQELELLKRQVDLSGFEQAISALVVVEEFQRAKTSAT